MRLLLSGALMLALGCAVPTEHGSREPIDAEPVASGPIMIVEPPPTTPRPEPESSAPPEPDEAQRMEAKRLFEAGVRLFELGDFSGAASKFEQAYILVPMPQLLFNIARAREQLGDVAGACEIYLVAAANDSLRDEARQRLSQLNCPRV